MGYLELPLKSQLPSYEYQVELEKLIYTVSLSWNERVSAWFIDLYTSQGVALVVGLRLMTSVDLLSRFSHPDLPPGTLFCLDTAGENKDPGRDDFGSRVILMYRESTTDE